MSERTCAYLVVVTATNHGCLQAKQYQVPTSDKGAGTQEWYVRLLNNRLTIVRFAENEHPVQFPLNSQLSASAPIDGHADLRTGMVLRAFLDKKNARRFVDTIEHLDGLLC